MIKLARYYHRSPDRLTGQELPAFFLYPAKDRGLSGATCRLYLNAIRFLYPHVPGRDSFGVTPVAPKRAQRIPELSTRAEVGRILSACRNFKHRRLPTTRYGCGLRVGAVVALKVRDLDGERHLLRVEQGKGAEDRNVIIARLLTLLRNYRRAVRPTQWLFPGREYSTPIGVTRAQRVFAPCPNVGPVSTRSAAFARSASRLCDASTGSRDAGASIAAVARPSGYPFDVASWAHWVPDYRESRDGADLIAGLEVRRLVEASGLQGVFNRFPDGCRLTHPLNPDREKACRHIEQCRTETWGGLQQGCDLCGCQQPQHH